MNLSIKTLGSRSFPYYAVMDGDVEFCNTKNIVIAESIVYAFLSKKVDYNKPRPSLDLILDRILKSENVDLRTNFSRERDFVNIRFIYCKIAADFGYTMAETGSAINRTHATIIYSLQKFDDIHDTDQKFRELYSRIKSEF